MGQPNGRSRLDDLPERLLASATGQERGRTLAGGSRCAGPRLRARSWRARRWCAFGRTPVASREVVSQRWERPGELVKGRGESPRGKGASHSMPHREPCAGHCEVAREALTVARAGGAMEHRKDNQFGAPRLSTSVEGNTGCDEMGETQSGSTVPMELTHVRKPEYTDRSMTGRDAGLPESSAGVPAFAGRCRSEQAPLGGAEGEGARGVRGHAGASPGPGLAPVSGRQASCPAQGQRFGRCRRVARHGFRRIILNFQHLRVPVDL